MAEPFGRTIVGIVTAGTERVLKKGDRALRRGRGAKLHALRIAFKRLRYTLEFVTPLSADRIVPALDALALVQEHLGRIADADAFARTYDELLTDVAAHDVRRPGLDMLRARTAVERTAALDALRTLWHGDEATAPYPERLAASISEALGSISPNEA